MNDTPLGFTHFLSQADPVARFILAAMLLASLVTWGIIVDRLVAHWLQRRRGARFLADFRRARSFTELADGLPETGDDAYARLARCAVDSARHHAAHGDAGGLDEFLTRTLRQGIEEEAERLERGLTLLASVGSTAPFVGLFGTVWGIYHALIAIGMSGQGTLDKVAGPVGEALIMTAIGLAVAIPAVLGYNALTRRNRVVLGRLDALGHDLLTLAVTGVPLQRGAHAARRVARAA
ncbi:MAG: MotA/TolQ/ExbB proton channel family protein [Rhodocyclaceae bacterium]|nr:MotA/TolQ/ExbB proton channel family protein [Rhodocyclaceae bacterium]